MNNNMDDDSRSKQPPSNKDQQGIDKVPGEEAGKTEKVTTEDLKGKKVDRDPYNEEDQPIRQLP